MLPVGSRRTPRGKAPSVGTNSAASGRSTTALPALVLAPESGPPIASAFADGFGRAGALAAVPAEGLAFADAGGTWTIPAYARSHLRPLPLRPMPA